VPTQIVNEIVDRTDGVPLFVEELTKAVLESGAESAAVLSAAPHPTLSVPATLHASLMARLDRLGSTAKDIAQRGAVIGREFGHELLASIADLPEPQLREALGRLTNSGLLVVRGTPPQSTYIFKHALVQDAAYGALLRGRRQHLHARIASALEVQFPEMSKSKPELLAHHFTEARLVERAIEYWLKAGQQALARSGLAEAEALLRKGLSQLLSLSDSVSRQEHELDLQITLGGALLATQGFGAPAVGEVYARARELCYELNRSHKLLPILYGQLLYQANRADLGRAQQLAAEIRQLGETGEDVVTRMTGCRMSGFTCVFLGEFAAARAYFEQALALYDPVHRRLEEGTIDALVSILAFSSLVLVCLGYPDQARSRRETVLAEARRLSHGHTLAVALSTPFRKMTPATTFGNWFSPFSRRQVFAAAMISLNTISRAVSCDSAPRVAHRPVPDRGEHALDRVRRPQVIPVLGRKIVERQ
jgi:tetratricopeptide (TPR) repeat protein